MYNLRKRFASASYTEEKNPTIKMKAKNWKKKKGGRLKCAWCGKIFRQNRHLKMHKCNYKCEFCKKVFGSNLRLTKHIKSLHLDHKCQYCQEEFSDKYRLTLHVRFFFTFCLFAYDFCLYQFLSLLHFFVKSISRKN